MLENSPLHQAIIKYIELNGVQPPDEKGHWSAKGMLALHVQGQYQDLKEAMDLDPSMTTAVLMMRKYVQDYASTIKTDAVEMLSAPEKFMAKVEAVREINRLLDIVEVNEAQDDFIAVLRTQLAHFGALDREDVQKALADAHLMARLRRDALKSVEKNLKLNQFLMGEHEPEDIKPIYVPVVHQYWSINALLATMANTPSGISLTLIRDPQNAYESYFAIAIRNGGNLMILTDIAKYAHPLGSRMTRKPERHLADRAVKNWFPYELLNLQVDENGELYIPERSDVKAVVATQNVNLPLKSIKDLEATDVIWITLVFDLLISKYWIRQEVAPQLSYTGEMLKVSDALTWQAKQAGLPVAESHPVLDLPPLTLDDVSSPDLREDQIGYIGPRPHQWLEDRFRDQVSPEVFNVVQEAGKSLLLMKDGRLVDRTELNVGEMDSYVSGEWNWRKAKESGAVQRVEQYVATRFGTPEEIEADRLWLARYNFATRINQLARDEYEAEKEKVRKIYFDAVRANIENVMRWVRGEDVYVLSNGQNAPESNRGYTHIGDRRAYRFQVFRDRKEAAKDRYDYTTLMGVDIFLEKYRRDRRDHNAYCCVTGAVATYTVRFDPATPQMIAAVMGCEISDLPLGLQHYEATPYMKNSILDRVDPMAFVVDNPWQKFDPSFRLHFSKRGLKEILRQRTEMPLEVAEKDENGQLKGSGQWTIRVN